MVVMVVIRGILLWCVLESDLILLQSRLVKKTAVWEKGIFLGRGELDWRSLRLED